MLLIPFNFCLRKSTGGVQEEQQTDNLNRFYRHIKIIVNNLNNSIFQNCYIHISLTSV